VERKVLDLDAAAPVETAVKFRGVEYVLGQSVLGVLEALRVAREHTDSVEGELQALPTVLRALSPDLAAALDAAPASAGETLALRGAVHAFVRSLGSLTFRPAGA
jgi:hypothetical protein